MNDGRPPEIKDEIERKCGETIEWLLHEQSRDAITIEQFETGIQSVWMCCAGLVSRELVSIMSEATEIIEKSKLEREINKGEVKW